MRSSLHICMRFPIIFVASIASASLEAVRAAHALPGSYQEDRAVLFAKLAGASYCSTSSLEAWSCGDKCIDGVSSVKTCQGWSTHAYVGKWEDGCVAAFQGTTMQQLGSWIRDLTSGVQTNWPVCEDCMVGAGFLAEWETLRSCMMDTLREMCPEGSPLRTTGHSLGAAVNGLATVEFAKNGWIIAEEYDFGKPRVGNAAYAKAWTQAVDGKAWRVTHGWDPVPNMPPDTWGIIDFKYEHVMPEIYYKGNLSDGYEECTIPHQKTCIEEHWELVQDMLHIDDHLFELGVHTGSDGCINGDSAVLV